MRPRSVAVDQELPWTMSEQEGCATPRRCECRIPAALVCPPPPRKKPVVSCGEKREPPKNGYFRPPDLESLFVLPNRREASCASWPSSFSPRTGDEHDDYVLVWCCVSIYIYITSSLYVHQTYLYFLLFGPLALASMEWHTVVWFCDPCVNLSS